MREIDFYPHFESYLNNLGMQTYIRLHVGDLETDIIGIRHYVDASVSLACIEVKKTDIQEVCRQAIIRIPYFHKISVGIAISKEEDGIGHVIIQMAQHLKLLTEKGIGVLVFDEARNKMFKVVEPINHAEPPNMSVVLPLVSQRTIRWKCSRCKTSNIISGRWNNRPMTCSSCGKLRVDEPSEIMLEPR